MKSNKFFLDFEEEEILIGLIKLKQQISNHELFFKVNQLNLFNFHRADDLMAEDYFRHLKLMMKLHKLNLLSLLTSLFGPKQNKQVQMSFFSKETKKNIL